MGTSLAQHPLQPADRALPLTHQFWASRGRCGSLPTGKLGCGGHGASQTGSTHLPYLLEVQLWKCVQPISQLTQVEELHLEAGDKGTRHQEGPSTEGGGRAGLWEELVQEPEACPKPRGPAPQTTALHRQSPQRESNMVKRVQRRVPWVREGKAEHRQ